MKFASAVVAFKTIARREVVRILRIWPQTLLPPVITLSLYFLIFGNLIGSQIADISGFSYIEYIVPGLIMMAVITNSYMNVSSSFFGSKFQKSIEELLVSPTPYLIIIMGFIIGGIFRSLIVGTIVFLVSLFFVKMHIFNLGIIILFGILSSIVFSLGGLLNALYAKKFDDISIIPTFVLTPLTYLGGVFYSISLLPQPWQTISKLNPILYMINGFRYGFLGISDINIYFALSMILVFIVVLFYVNIYLFRKGIGMKN